MEPNRKELQLAMSPSDDRRSEADCENVELLVRTTINQKFGQRRGLTRESRGRDVTAFLIE